MMTPEERAQHLADDLPLSCDSCSACRKKIAAAIREAQREQMERDAEIVLDIKPKAWTTTGILIETSETIRREFEPKCSFCSVTNKALNNLKLCPQCDAALKRCND